MSHIAVLTSGGDAPGMNAATRAAVRTAIAADARVTGVVRGFEGLIAGDFQSLSARSVSNIIQTGGTILKTSRSEEFLRAEGRAKAAARLREAGIGGLVGIGGDGTFRGLHALTVEHGIAVVGVPGTIDNDVFGTDFTIGFDTAANTALESIDKIRDTAASHDRVFFIEVMGRACGALALEVGVAGGAEVILVPEVPVDLDAVCRALDEGHRRGKTSYIIVVAEGACEGGAQAVADSVKARLGIDCRVSVIGHIQRGGAPTSFDRTLASRTGRAAVEALLAGETDVMAGVLCDRLTLVPLVETWEKRKPVDLDLLRLTTITSS
ncbi:MAG: 6-phosphofructokinase [Candidatus Eisenbacteria bacterium]|nr:6-phosphofructokinase [Candidatus Eisenbacteria bacterium]